MNMPRRVLLGGERTKATTKLLRLNRKSKAMASLGLINLKANSAEAKKSIQIAQKETLLLSVNGPMVGVEYARRKMLAQFANNRRKKLNLARAKKL